MPRHRDDAEPDSSNWREMERQISRGIVDPILLPAPGQDLRCPCHPEIARTSKETALC